MSKGLGQKIAIKFTEGLVDDVSGLSPTPLGEGYMQLQGVVTASSTYSTYYPDNAFDNNTSTYWYTRTTGTQWIQIELYVPTKSMGFRWYIGSSYRPNGFIVQGSNDGSSWDDIYTGASDNTTGWKEFAWDMTESYKYYRWSITSRYSSYLYIYEIELLQPKGQEQAFTVSGKQYQYINGPLLDMVYNVIKVELHPSETKAILLTMHPLSRFNNVEGNLTINYDATKGNLSGRGGAVESFAETFLPIDLVPVPNPGITETITVAPTEVVADFIEVEYQNRYAEETITVAPSEITATLIHVDEINP